MFKRIIYLLNIFILVILMTGCEDKEKELNKKIEFIEAKNRQLHNQINNLSQSKNEKIYELEKQIAILKTQIEEYKKRLELKKEILKKEYQIEFEKELRSKIRKEEHKNAYFMIIVFALILFLIYKFKIKNIDNEFNSQVDYYKNRIESLENKYINEREQIEKEFAMVKDQLLQRIKEFEQARDKDIDEVYKMSLLDDKLGNKLNEIDKAIDNCLNSDI